MAILRNIVWSLMSCSVDDRLVNISILKRFPRLLMVRTITCRYVGPFRYGGCLCGGG